MYPELFRRRLIPDECVALKDDIVVFMDEDIIVTKWNTLKPRNDFHHGYSCYFLKDGIKLSRFLRKDGSLYCWYCDVVSYEWERDKSSLVVLDLLADVTISPEGAVNVLDLDELCEAREKKMISEEQFFCAVKTLGNLLKSIQSGDFDKYMYRILNIIKY